MNALACTLCLVIDPLDLTFPPTLRDLLRFRSLDAYGSHRARAGLNSLLRTLVVLRS